MNTTASPYRPLPETFRRGGFTYRLLKRAGGVVLLEKTKPNLPGPMFEVAILRRRPEHTWPNGIVTPAREAMPPDEAFGREAWDFAYNRNRAEAAFARMAVELPPGAYSDASDRGGCCPDPPRHSDSLLDSSQPPRERPGDTPNESEEDVPCPAN